jgi:uncharacterized membrane protein
MAFMDDLALVEVLIGMAAVLFAYVGVLSWWAIRTNNPSFLRKTLKSSAIPMGGVGITTMLLAMWIEVAWPFTTVVNGTNVLGGYNIFFGDVMVFFGIVTIAYAVAAYVGNYLHVVGLLALVAGAATAFYGWTGLTAHPAFTKDPYDTWLMYGAFGASAVAAFPATIIMDYFLNASETGKSIWQRVVSVTTPSRVSLGTRAAQNLSAVESTPSSGGVTKYRVHWALQLVLLAFPALMICASVAAFWYFGTTLPGHLGNGAAGAP